MAHVLGEHAPYSQGTLHDGPTHISGPGIKADPRAGRVTPPPRSRTHGNTPLLGPSCPGTVGSYPNIAERCFHTGRGFTSF